MKYCVLCSILFIVFIVLMVETSIVENFHEYKYTAVIIEPREHPALEFVLKNFNANLSEEWQFVIFHGNKNIKFLLSEAIFNKLSEITIYNRFCILYPSFSISNAKIENQTDLLSILTRKTFQSKFT